MRSRRRSLLAATARTAITIEDEVFSIALALNSA
jgi:hypothetical protein